MPPINSKKKIDKLNQFVKVADRVVYFRMYHSRVLKETYNYMEIEDDFKSLIKTHFKSDCKIFYLGLLLSYYLKFNLSTHRIPYVL